MTNDMTKGKPAKLIIQFTVPILIGNIFQQFYNVVDSIIVGQFVGVNALAAVGATGSLVFLVIGWITGMTSGFGILISQCFGAGNKDRLRHFMAMSMYLCVAMTIIMTSVLLLTNNFVLRAMKTPGEIYKDSYVYLAIIYAGLAATFTYNMLSAILRSLGDSKTPLYFLVISSVLNIFLDLLFVAVFKMGVAGAGYATIISQAVSSILCLIYITKKYPMLKLTKKDMMYSWNSVAKLLAMGIPMGLQFSITAIGTMIVQVGLNTMGTIYIAAYTTASKIQNIVMQPFPSLGASIATFVGQNMGAGQINRIKEGVNTALKIAVGCSVVVMIIVFFFSDFMIRGFVSEDSAQVVSVARQFFMVTIWFYPFLSVIFVYRNALQGIGDGLVPMLGGVFELVARALVVILMAKPFGFVGLCLAHPIAWCSALIPLMPVYYHKMKKLSEKVLEKAKKVNVN